MPHYFPTKYPSAKNCFLLIKHPLRVRHATILNFELTLRSESRGYLHPLPSREEETPIHSA